jgi:hypothetical protein
MNATPSKKRELSKRGKNPSAYRRIVTENVNGKSVVQSDESLPAYELRLFRATSTRSSGSTRRLRISGRSRNWTAIPIPSFRDRAARACTT